MRHRGAFIVGAAVGYVLGSRAGRERYEQIRRVARQASESPSVQEAAGVLRAQAGTLAGTAKNTLQDKLGDRVPGLRRTYDPDTDRSPERRETTPIH